MRKLTAKTWYVIREQEPGNDRTQVAIIYARRKDTGDRKPVFRCHVATLRVIRERGLENVLNQGLLIPQTQGD